MNPISVRERREAMPEASHGTGSQRLASLTGTQSSSMHGQYRRNRLDGRSGSIMPCCGATGCHTLRSQDCNVGLPGRVSDPGFCIKA